MKNFQLLLFTFFCFFFINVVVFAQDIHSSNYSYNSTYLNPAENGAFLGTVRVMGSYRDQFDAFFVEGYNTQVIGLDMPLNLAFLKRGWTGIGMGLFTDKAGELGLRSTGFSTTLSYHFPFDKNNNNVFSFGAQFSNISRSNANPDQAQFTDMLSGGGGVDLGLLENFSENYTDYNFGVLFRSNLSKTMKLKLGASVLHTFRSSKFNNNGIYRRVNAHADLPFIASKRLQFTPRIYTSFSKAAFNINPQFLGEYYLRKEFQIGAGLGYRVQDALQLLLFGNYKGWELGMSYDFTISSASRYNYGRGGLEIGLRKIFTLYKKPKIKSALICPRL